MTTTLENPTPKICKYTLGSRIYTQRQLVLGQLEDLAKAISALPLASFMAVEGMEGEGLMSLLKTLLGEGKLVSAMAIVLIPYDGKPIKDRDLSVIEDDIRNFCSLEGGVEIITDFFECNASSKLVSTWKGSMLGQMMTKKTPTAETTVPPSESTSGQN